MGSSLLSAASVPRARESLARSYWPSNIYHLYCKYQLVGSAIYMMRLQYGLSDMTIYMQTYESTIYEVAALELLL